ncbi:MAG: hypothetical protein QXU40_03395 [Candidatus Pacearchaeota archaeon]
MWYLDKDCWTYKDMENKKFFVRADVEIKNIKFGDKEEIYSLFEREKR